MNKYNDNQTAKHMADDQSCDHYQHRLSIPTYFDVAILVGRRQDEFKALDFTDCWLTDFYWLSEYENWRVLISVISSS